MSSIVISLSYTSSIFPILSKMFSLLSSCLLPHHVWTASTLPLNLQLGGNPVDRTRPAAKKKCSFPTSEKFPSPNSKFHVITQVSFIAALLLLHNFFNFRFYVQIYHANFDYSMFTESICNMAKALNGQNFSKQNFQPLSPSFNAIWKTLLQLLLVLLFTPSLFYFELYNINFFWPHGSCDCIAYELIK